MREIIEEKIIPLMNSISDEIDSEEILCRYFCVLDLIMDEMLAQKLGDKFEID